MPNNGDTDLKVQVGSEEVVGLGSFHKTLPHDKYGEVIPQDFNKLVKATKDSTNPPFGGVPEGNSVPPATTAAFTNPRAGLAKDRLTQPPRRYTMPPAPLVLSETTAAEMTELYWMALLRDVPFDEFDGHTNVQTAAVEIDQRFGQTTGNTNNSALLQTGVDVPGHDGARAAITPQNLFRLGLPGEEAGPLVSQFFLRGINFGTQTIDQRQYPYRKQHNYLTRFDEWLLAQNSGNGTDGRSYSGGNEESDLYYEPRPRYISTMRDLARFVHKDALHQAYFNAALLMLSGGAKWTPGNPYGDGQPLQGREAGFGTLGGPHILALVSEVATRALKIVWHEKWQVHLRLRPEAYGGLVHVQNIGVEDGGQFETRAYGLPAWVAQTEASNQIRTLNSMDGNAETLLLPMAFTSGSPLHPAYGAGHATVAGACVTVLKAFFRTFDDNGGSGVPVPFVTANEGEDGGLMERQNSYDPSVPFQTYASGVDAAGVGRLTPVAAGGLTLEGELNKLAMNVAMGRSMGGVHWRTDNTRSLMLGEAMAARVLLDITEDLEERRQDLAFTFRTFSRKADGNPKIVVIDKTGIKVDGMDAGVNPNAL